MYQIVRSLPLPSDTTKLILDYVGKTKIAKMIHHYFKYPLSRLELDEWWYSEYTHTIVSVNDKYYFNELTLECQSGVEHVLEFDSLHHNRLDVVDWDSTDIVSCQYKCITQNYPTFEEEYEYYYSRGLGVSLLFQHHWDGVTEFAYTNTALFD